MRAQISPHPRIPLGLPLSDGRREKSHYLSHNRAACVSNDDTIVGCNALATISTPQQGGPQSITAQTEWSTNMGEGSQAAVSMPRRKSITSRSKGSTCVIGNRWLDITQLRDRRRPGCNKELAVIRGASNSSTWASVARVNWRKGGGLQCFNLV